MKTFSPLQFAMHLVTLAAAEHIAMQKGLKKAAILIEKTAKGEFGVYQPEAGPFQDWEQLAESTKEQRVKQGYTENDPLLRTGKLRDSISHEVRGLEAQIGSTDDVMVYQEFGTANIPPRPVLGPAAYRNKEKIKKILGKAAVEGLIGGERIHQSLGYDS